MTKERIDQTASFFSAPLSDSSPGKRKCFVFISFLHHIYHHLIYNDDDNGENHQGQWSPRWSWASSSPPQSKAWGPATASRMRRTCRGRWWRRRWRWSTSRESPRSACGDLLHRPVGGQGWLPPKCFDYCYKSLKIGMEIGIFIVSNIVIIIVANQNHDIQDKRDLWPI